MSDESRHHNLLIGAAVVAGILGTVSAIIRSNITVTETREVASQAGEAVNKNMLLGGLAGGIIGAATALVLAPKSGSELMKDIAHTFTHPGELIHSTSGKKNSEKSSSKSSRSKNTSSKAKRKEHAESKSVDSGKSRKSSSKKKSPPRRRTASAALKEAASDKSASSTVDDLEV